MILVGICNVASVPTFNGRPVYLNALADKAEASDIRRWISPRLLIDFFWQRWCWFAADHCAIKGFESVEIVPNRTSRGLDQSAIGAFDFDYFPRTMELRVIRRGIKYSDQVSSDVGRFI